MKKLTISLLTMVLTYLFTAVPGYAGTTKPTLIKGIVWADPTIHPKEGIEVWLVDATNAGIGPCLNLHPMVLLLTSDPKFNEKYNMLMAAYLSKRNIRIYSNKCVTYGNYQYGVVQSIIFADNYL